MEEERYTLEEISELLRYNGINLSPEFLKRLLNEYNSFKALNEIKQSNN